MRVGLTILALVAVALGMAGAATLLVERRLATLTPGGVTIGRLDYRPLGGRLVLDDVRARDAAGRVVFRAERVSGRVDLLRLLLHPLTLSEARVTAPELTLPAASGLDVVELATGLGFARSGGPAVPVRVEDLAVDGGRLVVEGGGEGGAPLLVRDLDVRLSRLTTATVDPRDVAFAVEMTVYGTVVHLTGQPRGAGYALRVRAHGVDVAALLRDFPVAALHGLERGHGDIDAGLLLAGGRVLMSGHVRVADVVLVLPVPGRPRLRAATLAVAADVFDLVTGTGRISRVEIGGPSLSLPQPTALATLAALAEPLRGRRGLIVRRVAVTDGVLDLDGTVGLALERIRLSAQLSEAGDGRWTMSARAALGVEGEVAIDGALARDLGELDAVTRLRDVALAPWRALAGLPAGWDAQLSFDGRLRATIHDGEPAALVTGAAVLADVGTRAGFRADRIAFGIRRLQWPGADPVVDRVVMTRPAFALPPATPWPRWLVTGDVSVVEGELRWAAAGPALRQLTLSLTATDTVGAARLQLSASTDRGDRLGLDRIVTYDGSSGQGIPLPLLVPVLEDAARTAPASAGRGAPAPAAAAMVAPTTIEPMASCFRSP